jgi:hypothetical protein
LLFHERHNPGFLPVPAADVFAGLVPPCLPRA